MQTANKPLMHREDKTMLPGHFADPFERAIQEALDAGWVPATVAQVQAMLDKTANEQKLGVRASALPIPDAKPPTLRWALHAPNQEAALRFADLAAQANGIEAASVVPSLDGGVLRLFVEATGGTVVLFEPGAAAVAQQPSAPTTPAAIEHEARVDLPRTPRVDPAAAKAPDQWSREWWAGQLLRVHSDLVAARFTSLLQIQHPRVAAHVGSTLRVVQLSIGLVQSQEGRFDVARARFTLASPTNHVEPRTAGQIDKPAALLLHPSERVASMAIGWLVESARTDQEIGALFAVSPS